MKTLVSLFVALFSTAVSADLPINDALSTEQAISDQPNISIIAIGVVEEDGEDVLRIEADMPDRIQLNTTRTPGAAIGNRQIACDVIDVSPFTPDRRLFICDLDEVRRGMVNRVCIGYEESFQFQVRSKSLTPYADNRCIDFLAL